MPVVVATGDLHHTIPRLSVGRASVGWRHNMHKTGKALQNVGKGMYVSLACGLRRRSLHFDTLAYSGACVLMALITSHSLCFLRGRRASADLIPSWQELLIRPGGMALEMPRCSKAAPTTLRVRSWFDEGWKKKLGDPVQSRTLGGPLCRLKN